MYEFLSGEQSFVKVGGSAWKLKIDTERFQGKEDNDLEEESETRNGKSTPRAPNRSPREPTHTF